MIKLAFNARFTTPAFLGDAEQHGQWRTPPFKALLRQCWRIAYSASTRHAVDVERMRIDEAQLFGAAADTESASGLSLVRLRLDRWTPGKTSLPAGREQKKIAHPVNNNPIDPLVYLGYGRVEQAPATIPAIPPEQPAVLRLGILDDHPHFIPQQRDTLFHAVGLMREFGALGGRSRNGYGSLWLEPTDETTTGLLSIDDEVYRDWRECLSVNWPHALGRDEHGPLVWQTVKPTGEWQDALRELARRRVALNATLKLEIGEVTTPSERHLVGYPRGAVKGKPNSVRSWKDSNRRDLRLPNSLRLKVVPDPDQASRLHGRIVHIPCAPTEAFQGATRERLEAVWTKVHRVLDEDPGLQRVDRLGGGLKP